MTMTPTTRVPNVSGTTTCDSSIESVPGRIRANSQLAASPIKSDSPISATRPVIPSPTLQARISNGSCVSLVNWPTNAIGITSSPFTSDTRQLW